MVCEGTTEKPFGGGDISLGAQRKIHRLSHLVDGAIEINPAALDLDVSLVDAPRSADPAREAVPPLFELGKVALNEIAAPHPIGLVTILGADRYVDGRRQEARRDLLAEIEIDRAQRAQILADIELARRPTGADGRERIVEQRDIGGLVARPTSILSEP